MTNLTRKGLPKHKEVHESHKSLKFPESLDVNETPKYEGSHGQDSGFYEEYKVGDDEVELYPPPKY